MSKPFPVGKLDADLLARLLKRFELPAERVILGPKLGEDVAVVDMGDRYLVAKIDPITFAADQIGWYAVHINANDLATSGAEPRWFMTALLLPEGGTQADLVEAIFQQVYQACAQVGLAWIGGHTEITYGLDRPILVGAMLGEVAREDLVTTGGAQIGDAILLTKALAVEGTAVVAREARERLLALGCSEELLKRCAQFLYQPGISVLPEASVIKATCRVNSLHDPTEGGIATGLHELAEAAGVGVVLDLDALPVYPETRQLCDVLGLDPLGLLASGSLLVTLPPEDAISLRDRLLASGIQATLIGWVTPPQEGVSAEEQGTRCELARFQQDEVARLFT